MLLPDPDFESDIKRPKQGAPKYNGYFYLSNSFRRLSETENTYLKLKWVYIVGDDAVHESSKIQKSLYNAYRPGVRQLKHEKISQP